MTTIVKHTSSIKRTQISLASMDLFLKFMAKRGISIEYGDVQTAYYDLENNVITLPNYVLDDIDLFIRFGTHEAAHSLFTPKFFYSEHNTTSHSYSNTRSVTVNGKTYELSRDLFSCINIVEDIRIEKLIRQHFPGLIAPYRRSAEKLSKTRQWSMLLRVKGNQDVFDELSLADKINLKSKFKEFLNDVDMTDREYAILKYLSKASSFNDVLVRSLFLYKLMTSEKDVNQMSQKDINDLMQQDANAPDGFEDLESLDELDKQSILDNRCDEAEASGDSSQSAPDESNIEDIMSDMQDASRDAPDNDSKVKTSEVGTSPQGSTNCTFDGESKATKLFADQLSDQLSNIAGHTKIIMRSWTI